jgi:hypothetical protein
MKFIPHFSSSSGNLYEVVADNGHRLLIECGVTYKALRTALKYDLKNIDGCLVTHSHKDHSKAILDILKAGIDVYASAETLQSFDALNKRRAYAVSDKTLINTMPTFQIYCFEVHHDCSGALGFIVLERLTGEYLLFATDTAFLHQTFKYPFSIIALECSYQIDILERQVALGEINETVAKRLLNSHMEKANTLTYLRDHCDLSHCREIHLLHCSGDRLNKKQAQAEFQEKLFVEVKVK